ncbi:hypothetical protein [Streptomyces sp. NPDC059639]|uniref:hypothetical protein n=1 Tax=Streptomyces sp. NPDC059639 TaxID=3346891 RepID=UPI0036B5C1F8
MHTQREYHLVPYADSQGSWLLPVVQSKDGSVRLANRIKTVGREEEDLRVRASMSGGWTEDVVQALRVRCAVGGLVECSADVDPSTVRSRRVDELTASVLSLPVSSRWREAVSTAVSGNWCDPLRATGHLPVSALGALKAEARQIHRHLVPLWRRGTRHGRVLSLDATLGDSLSLYDLVAADVDSLAHMTDGVFEDDRLNRVLRGMKPAERQVVFAYAESEGTTWTEAAAHAGALHAEAFGERVRRKAKRLAAEQARRAAATASGGDGLHS